MCSVKHKTLNINKGGRAAAGRGAFCSVRHALAHIRAGERCHREGRELSHLNRSRWENNYKAKQLREGEKNDVQTLKESARREKTKRALL